ncbi:Glycoside hydrolase/deacetylase beta/alpha-barrel [Penicillium expansum]|nr:Glycoside hydrolase/deacetylase beta/alpha-barrel [Penicillium expansum]
MHFLAPLIPFLLSATTLSQAAPTGTINASKLPVGAIITHCTTPGTIALTFDDGPYIYTPQILDTLAEHGMESPIPRHPAIRRNRAPNDNPRRSLPAHPRLLPDLHAPPFLRHTPVVLGAMTDLGYHVIGASVDTKDFENDNPDTNWISFEKFKREVDAGGTIVLAHDAHQYTVEILVDNMLADVERRGLRAVTVGECLGDPPEYWYRAGR